ncbi:chlorophyll a/b-binding protein domain-containing protein [Ochromonadaceae sp. CCMP2298]|nr:chlorophyll a/b-binding protein domain-containing protein [Ochromonadaceae sp. CCMP2298]
MFRSLLIALCITAAAAFTVSNGAVRSTALAAKSKALPFLEAPAKLDGSIVGDFGFDPLGFTDTLQSLNYVRAAELKHGRVAMLATVGFLVQQSMANPSLADPLKATFALGYGPNLQILSFIGVIELATWDKTFAGDASGDLGFDPLNLSKGKTEKEMDALKLKELKNGRLAMIGIMGMFAQNLATGGAPTI